MTVQMRSPTDGRAYSPDGDIAHNFIDLLRRSFYGLEPHLWEDWYGDYLKFKGATAEDLEKVALAMAQYIRHVGDPEVKDPLEALTKAGFFETNSAAQLAVMAKLGQILTCAYFTRFREAHTPNYAEVKAAELMKEAEVVSRGIVARYKTQLWDKVKECWKKIKETWMNWEKLKP